MMKIITTIFLLSILHLTGWTQNNEDTAWKAGGVISLNINQAKLSNWTAGGEDALALNGVVSLFGNYNKNKIWWENSFDLSYGLVNTESFETFRKNDDNLRVVSKVGRKLREKLYLTFMANFKTQIAPGYDYEDSTSTDYITSFMSPAYLLLPLGFDFKPTEAFSLFYSPLTAKLTFILDEQVDETDFGLDSGKTVRTEIGTSLSFNFEKEVLTNVKVKTRLDLFTNYLDSFGNIDINWETLIAMKVNKYLSATVSTNLIYDDDIILTRSDETQGVGLQFKEVLAIGFSYQF